MEPSGSMEPLVLVVGEAPGAEEDERDEPFVGQSGRLLRNALENVGLNVRADVAFTNVVKCRPPDNKITKKAIELCKHYVFDEIAEYKPKIVMLLGNSPLNAVLGESGVTTWNGVVVERDGITYVPLFHPAYILRNMSAMDEWLSGMMKAVDTLFEDDEPDSDVEHIFPKTRKDLDDMLEYFSHQEAISFDVETASLDPFADHNLLLAVSFAAGDRAYSFPIEHEEDWWSNEESEDYAIRATRLVLEVFNCRVIGHNIKFDQQHARHLLSSCFEAGGDTMLLSHLLDSRQGIHGLKRLAGIHLGMYDYDKPLQDYIKTNPRANPNRGGSYAAIPLSLLLPYAAMDAYATYRLHDILYDKLSPKQKHLYHELIIPASNTLARMEFNGIRIDDFVADRYVTIYRVRQEEIYEEILKDKKVQKLIKDKQKEIDDARKPNSKAKPIVYRFNPNSVHQLKELYFKYYKMPITDVTETGEPSTKAGVMKPLEKKYPIISLIRYYKLLTKMLGTYLEPALNGQWKRGDGRVHSNYNLHGTRTGRLSSSNPNLQNIPTPEKEPGTLLETMPIKNIFTYSFPKGVVMSVDYSGMELRVFASLARCQSMIGIHESGADFHSMVAIMSTTGRDVHEITKEEANKFKDEFKPVRYRYKWTNWTLLYGGDEYTLVSLYSVPVDDAKATVKAYYDRFPEVLEFREWTTEFGKENGYIESPFGRREHLHYINDKDVGKANKDKRAAVNMPVQSGASDTLLCALVIIDKFISQRGLRSMLVNTVHDSIVLDVHPDEIDEVAALCVDVMENIKHYASIYMPNVDFEWLICPLKADVDVGTHYGAYVDYKDYKAGVPL
jgi:uracil-DNA glycosylase family 4